MHKLLKIDIGLVALTIAGLSYLYSSEKISLDYTGLIFAIYLLSKLIGYWILPYSDFDTFLNELTSNSKLKILSGFEIFKTVLVTLLFIGFLFINPSIWIIESILVVMMRVWGYAFINQNNNYNKGK